MQRPLQVLLVEDNSRDAELLVQELRRAGFEPAWRRVETEPDYSAALDAGCDIILSDFELPLFGGMRAIELLRASGREIPLIVVSGMIGEETAVAAMKQGATDYLLKDRLARLGPAINHALEQSRLRREHKDAELALRESEKRFKDLFDNAPVGYHELNAEGRLVRINHTELEMLGYSAEELLGRFVWTLTTDEESFRQTVLEKLGGLPSLAAQEILFRRRDGSTIPVLVDDRVIEGEAGAIVGIRTVMRDITDRKRADEALQQSEERYRVLFESNPLPMWLYDLDTLRFIAVNDSTVQQYGYTRAEFLAIPLNQISVQEDPHNAAQTIIDGRPGNLAPGEGRHRRKDGSIISVETIERALAFDGRAVRLVLAVDVTEKKLLQEKFLHAQRLESLGMLAAGIAHDLNNILAPIIFAGPLLRVNASTPGDLKVLDALERSAERGTGLVRQILAFSHSTTGGLRHTQVKHIAHDVFSMAEETFPKSIVLEHQISSDLWPVMGDPTQLHQVLLNLCVNARDAMPKGGTLQLTAKNRRLELADAAAIPGGRPGVWIMLEVADSGTGIAPEVLARIWEPFFTTKPVGKGTGLGLATVRGIVASHFGFVDVHTEIGSGTTFRVFLPAVENATVPAATASASVSPEGHGELVLVVEDDAPIREIVGTILGTHGYRVLTCGDGLEAIRLFTAHSREIALVVTDINMPIIGGATLVRVLLQLRPEIRLVAMSGLSRGDPEVSDIQVVKKLTHAFLVKPFKPEDLLGTVHHVLHPYSKLN